MSTIEYEELSRIALRHSVDSLLAFRERALKEQPNEDEISLLLSAVKTLGNEVLKTASIDEDLGMKTSKRYRLDKDRRPYKRIFIQTPIEEGKTFNPPEEKPYQDFLATVNLVARTGRLRFGFFEAEGRLLLDAVEWGPDMKLNYGIFSPSIEAPQTPVTWLPFTPTPPLAPQLELLRGALREYLPNIQPV